jgi:hypothetical protein
LPLLFFLKGAFVNLPPQGLLALLLFRQVFAIGGVVLRAVFQVADDDVVQRADRLTEPQRRGERADKANPVAAEVWRERHGQPARTPHDRTAPTICKRQLHRNSL